MKLLETIEQAFHNVKDPSPHELRARIAELELTVEKIAEYISQPSHLPYGRRLLFQSDAVEAILIHLPAGSQTFIHDHGASVGCARILEGQMTNIVYNLDREGYAYELGRSTVNPYGFVQAPYGQIHQMSNEGRERMVSFHVYAPRMTGMKRYFTYEQVLDYVI
jgi:cysteine dioxygenase